MLKGNIESLDLKSIRDELHKVVLENYKSPEPLHFCASEDVYTFNYPVLVYPEKIKSLSFDKTAEVSGKLMGMKGQYMYLDSGVINMRKFAGYLINCKIT